MWCHLLLFMPLIGLGVFIIFPLEVAFPTYAIASVTSLFIYYKVMRAMRQPVQSGREEMVGAIATVVTPMDSAGRVRYRNEFWSVVSEEKLRPGQRVRIMGFKGLKLIVSGSEGTEAEISRRSHCEEGARR
ncbi:MAG: NfeD family protein [Anaerolineae bacterium]